MIDMLDEIVEKTKERLVESKKNKSLDDLKDEVAKMNITQDFPFKEALSGDEISIINNCRSQKGITLKGHDC